MGIFIENIIMMNRTITVFLLVFITGLAMGQDANQQIRIIRGVVINSVTSEPVSYTNIGMEGTLFGTASNAEGNFELKVPEEFFKKNIYFSAVGFKNLNFPVSQLFHKEFHIIKLDPQSYDIDDIDVAARSKVLIRILRMAAENTRYNFIGGPFNLFCTYSNQKVTDDTVKVIREKEVIIYDKTGYTVPSIIDAFRSRGYSVGKTLSGPDEYRFLTGGTQMDELLGLDWVRSGTAILNPAQLADFDLKLVSEPVIDGSACWEISFVQPEATFTGTGDYYAKKMEGKIVIRQEDYSVVSIKGKINSQKNSLHGRSIAVGSQAVQLNNAVSEFEVQYQNLKPEIIRLTKKYTLEGKNVLESSLLNINRVQTTDPVVIDTRDYYVGD